MRGRTTCRFLGGPQGDVEMDFAAIECKEKIALILPTWMKQGVDGGAVVMQGMPDLSADWLNYHLAVYQKDKTAREGGVNYTYVESRTVSRCEHFLEKAQRRCRHEAQPDGVFCRQHAKGK